MRGVAAISTSPLIFSGKRQARRNAPDPPIDQPTSSTPSVAAAIAAYPADAAAGIFDGEIPLKSTLVIPKPFDPRVVPHVARKVAEAAMKSGVAQIQIDDLDAYEAAVAKRIGKEW